MNPLPVYDDRYMQTKLRTCGNKLIYVDILIQWYANVRGLNVQEDGVEWEPFTIVSTDPLLVYENKYYLQVHLDNLTYKIVG